MQNIPNKIDLTTTLPASEFNSHKNEIQELVTQSGQTLDINEQDQLRAAVSVFGRALVCNDTGTANAYVLARATTLTDVKTLYDGLTIAFQTSNTNTGPSSVNFNSLGVIPIVKNNVAIVAGDIDSNMLIVLVYNSINNNFEIFNLISRQYAINNPININALTAKPTPVDTDELIIADSATSFSLKKLTWANLEAALKTYFDTLYGNFVANDTRVKTALNADGTAPIYACRAWVNFDGTGSITIRDSGNVSSITDNGVGDYSVNFIFAMSNASYSVQCTVAVGDVSSTYSYTLNPHEIFTPTSGQIRVESNYITNATGRTKYDNRQNFVEIRR